MSDQTTTAQAGDAKHLGNGLTSTGKPKQVRGSEVVLEGTCGAQIRKSHPPRYCMHPPLASSLSGRCRLHGGKAPKGMANHRYGAGQGVPGSYSKYVPTRLAADYARAHNDPDGLSHRHEIKFWSAREQELSRRLDTGGDPGQAWPLLQSAWHEITSVVTLLQTAMRTSNDDLLHVGMRKLPSAITTGQQAIDTATQDYYLYDKIKDAHEFLLRLRAVEHKRMLDAQQTWTSEQVTVRFQQMMTLLFEACVETLPPAHIRPFLSLFQGKIDHLTMQAGWRDVTPLQAESVPPHQP